MQDTLAHGSVRLHQYLPRVLVLAKNWTWIPGAGRFELSPSSAKALGELLISAADEVERRKVTLVMGADGTVTPQIG